MERSETSASTSTWLLGALTQLQARFLQHRDARRALGGLWAVLREWTGSASGFIGEFQATPEGASFLHLYTEGAGEPPERVALEDLGPLLGGIPRTGEAVLSQEPGEGARWGGPLAVHPPPRSLLGLPLRVGPEVVGLVVLTDREEGYDARVVASLEPVLVTCRVILQGLREERGRQRAEAGERRWSESFRALLDAAPDAILVHREGRVVFANSMAARLVGQPEDVPMEGQRFADFVLPEDADLLEPTPDSPGPREVRLRHRLALRVVAEVSTVSLLFDGQPTRVSIARDVTGRRQEQEQLRATERMVSLGTLAAGVAHEINNPLSYLLSNLRFVDEELAAMREAGEALTGERGREVCEALHEALAGTHRVRDIVRDLKTFSRDSEDSVESVDVCGVLDSCVNMAWGEIRHRALLEKDYGVVPRLEANASRLGQIFLNLLVNAAHAIPHGDREGNRIHVSTHHEEGLVVVAIRDSGVGISPENLGKLFHPLFTTKPVGQGTGLGLSICHNLVTAMGGRIGVDSVEGQGTTFRVVLPVKRPTSISR